MRTTLDLTLAVARDPLALDAPFELDPVSRAVVEATWRGRMVNEHASARVFASLVPQMIRAGVEPLLIDEVAAMVQDELRHARRCAAVLAALGAPPVAELPALADVPAHEDAPPMEGVLRNVLSIACLSETVAVSLIEAERRALGEGPLADVLKDILGDEVRHARLGWRMLEAAPPDAALRTRLSRYLKVAFGHLEAHELAHLSPLPPPSAAAAAAGACDGREARAIFCATVEEVIVPRLESHGLAAREAWAHRVVPAP